MFAVGHMPLTFLAGGSLYVEMASAKVLPPFGLFSALLLFLPLCTLSSANAKRNEGCSDKRVALMCRITPLGNWQGRPTYDPYDALGVPPNAPLASIQQAYRVKARACHPDKLRLACPAKQEGNNGDARQEQEEEPFVIINAAYEMLRRPEHRRVFDAKGSGDGGRFVKRGHFTSTARQKEKASSIIDIVKLFAEGLHFNSDTDEEEEDEDEDEEEEADFPGFGLFEEERGEEIHFDWDFPDLGDIF